jgi:hypothetical protein
MNTNPGNASSSPRHRRRIVYVDSEVQRPLLVILVLLEVTLVFVFALLAYEHFNALIDESLFRVHIAEPGPVWKRLASEGVWMMGLFAAINVIALAIAAGFWSRRQHFVLQEFNKLNRKTAALDFSSDAPVRQPHGVLSLTLAWRTSERARFEEARTLAANLRSLVLRESRPEEVENTLKNLKSCLQ